MSDKKQMLVKLSINASAVRQEMFEGRPHTVLPCVAAVAGVLNGAKVTAEELGRFPASWDGRPIPLLHPQQHGENISANLPDVLERAIGTCFNTIMDGEALKTEFWIDNEKMDRIGQSALLAAMADGTAIIEVSTAYFADTIVNIGEFKGKRHEVEHKNLRPDHIAILPGQVGACSIEDGCGVPRVNNDRRKGIMKELIEALRKGLGLKTNCGCEGGVDVMKVAETLKANGKLTGKQFESLAAMDEEQRGMVGAILGAMTEADKAAAKAAKKAEANAEGGDDGEEEEEEDLPAANKKPKANAQGKVMTNADINALVDQRVADRLDRAEVKAELKANAANPFDDEELDTLPVASLKKTAKALRPVDYSGQGGFSTNRNPTAEVTGNAPLLVNRGVLAASKKEEAKH